MRTQNGNRCLESTAVFGQCKDFICPPESQIREWFPTLLQGRLRAAALDPYGTLKYKSKLEQNETITYSCQIDECHAKIILRKVAPDPEGNGYGLYGCFAHQHEMPRNKKSEIIFRNQKEAQEFFDQNFKKMYRKKWGDIYHCRRTKLKEGYGHNSCQSKISIIQFLCQWVNVELKSIPTEEKPYILSGYFYHAHENDKKYHRTDCGGWTCHNDDSDKPKSKGQPRIKNGKIFPLSARMAGVTVNDILAEKKGKNKMKKKKGEEKKSSLQKLDQ